VFLRWDLESYRVPGIPPSTIRLDRGPWASQTVIFPAQTACAYRYRDVDVVSMRDRWIEAEFEAIFREHYGRIIRVTRRVLRRDSEAEEVCADVFLRLYRRGPGVTADGLVGGWLYRTATRASIDALRAHRRRGAEVRGGDVEDDGGIQGEDPAESPLTLLLRQELIDEVREVLAKLKVERAQLLLLRHSGLTYQEIAQAMRLEVHSVGSKLARAEAEFSAIYGRHQRRHRKTQQLQTAKEGQ
jgi:RNA polymerase sigma factor (sigma-70 family)